MFGPAFQNSCLHSGENEYSGGNTVWYNYVIASAGTIIDENTSSSNPANNTTPATESICPKGWTIPSKTQIDSQRNATNFSPVHGGYYSGGTLQVENEYGFWWGSEESDGIRRYSLSYDKNNNLYTYDDGLRHRGIYVRCVVKKNTKTLSNLTYMQDVTFFLDFSEW